MLENYKSKFEFCQESLRKRQAFISQIVNDKESIKKLDIKKENKVKFEPKKVMKLYPRLVKENWDITKEADMMDMTQYKFDTGKNNSFEAGSQKALKEYIKNTLQEIKEVSEKSFEVVNGKRVLKK